jgi:hypothetical protein
MGWFNKLFKRNVEGIVAPNQYYNPTTDDYEVVQGSNGAAQVSLAGSLYRLSTDPKPTVGEGAANGVMLVIVDVPGEYHIYYKGQWYKQ